MKKRLFLLIILIIVWGCSPQRQKKKKDNNSPKNNVISCKIIKPKSIEEYVNIQGKLKGMHEVILQAEVTGKITKIYKELGEPVKKGEKIAEIDNIDIYLTVEQAEANYLATEANYESEQIKIKSTEKLYKNKDISKVEYKLSLAKSKQIIANFKAAKANLELAKRKLENSQFTAPIDGYIATLPISIGNLISMGQEICSIVNTKKMHLYAGIGENDINSLKIGNKVELKTKNSQKNILGKIIGVGKKQTDGIHYPVKIEIANKNNNLFSGQFVSGKITFNIIKNKIILNESEIVKYNNKAYIFYITPKNKIIKKYIKIEKQVRNYLVISSGIKIGDKIAIDKLDSLVDNETVTIKNLPIKKTEK